MKKSLFVLIFMMLSAIIFAQTQDSLKMNNKDKNNDEIKTLFDHPEKGGFFSLNCGISNITDKQVLMIGLRFGSTLNHWFSYGLGGSLLVSQITYDNIMSNKMVELEMGYMGLFVEPSIGPKMPFHVSFPILFGGGIASYNDKSYRENFNWVSVDHDFFYVIEPGAELEMNFMKHTRICLGLKYRIVSDLTLLNTKKDAFNGLIYGLTLKFGKF
jgi:hypothetical protein